MLSSGLRKEWPKLKSERAPGLADKRFVSTYLYAAVRPTTDDAFALVLPEVNANTMDIIPRSLRRKPRAEHPRHRARSSRMARREGARGAVGGAIHSSCLEPKEVVEESRFSSYIHGLQRQRDAYGDHIGFSRARLGIVSPSEPVVVDADCLKLGLHRQHDQH